MSGLFGWTARKESAVATPNRAMLTDAPPVNIRISSKVLPRFLSVLAPMSAPVVMDLGPVVGQNIAFFGDRLSCKFLVVDLFGEIETLARKNALDGLGAALGGRLAYPPGTADGILCWDLFDVLDRRTAHAVATKLVGLLKPGGALHGFFGTAAGSISHYTRFVVEAPDAFELRTRPATPVQRNVLVTRDINKMFDGLNVAESVLLKTSTREVLFRKP